MDQTQVYKRQEKEFNIINFHPKEYKPNLRQFPKLTVEDKLNEGIKQRKNDWLVYFYQVYLSSSLIYHKLTPLPAGHFIFFVGWKFQLTDNSWIVRFQRLKPRLIIVDWYFFEGLS